MTIPLSLKMTLSSPDSIIARTPLWGDRAKAEVRQMVALLIDECISPRLSGLLWNEGIDNYHLRDRSMLQLKDYQVWSRVMQEGRTLVTSDLADFQKFARRETTHPGVITIPNGSAPVEQLGYVLASVAKAKAENAIMVSLRDRFYFVRDDGAIQSEEIVGAGQSGRILLLPLRAS